MIRAIQTKFAGYHFRSRTEARYAVMFAALRVEFEFERQGFSLSEGPFLPDFYLPRSCVWFEIKGRDPEPGQIDLCHALATEIGDPVCLCIGQPDWTTPCTVFSPGGTHRVVQLSYVLRQLRLFDRDIMYAINESKSARFEFGETPLFTPTEAAA